MMLSIIIPTLNESAVLPTTVRHTRCAAGNSEVQIVVSDCHSRDDTARIAGKLHVDQVVQGATCRAEALNRGAALARGDVLLFLHADSLVPDRFDWLIGKALGARRIVGGAFDFSFGGQTCTAVQRHLLDWVVMCNRIRFRWTGNFYGDQSIFVRQDVFSRVGGFPLTTLFEDIYFCRRMQRAGRTAIIRPPVITSPRRFLARGVIRQFGQDLAMLACESIGLRPADLWENYNRLNHDAHRAFHSAAKPLSFEHAAT